MKTRLLIVFFLVLRFTGSNARESGYSMDGNCLRAYELILQLRTGEAAVLLNQEMKISPGNDIVPYLQNYSDFLKIIISEEEPLYHTLLDSSRQRLEQLESGNPASPWHLYCLAQFNMQWGFARLKFGDYSAAALELNRSYRQLVQNRKQFPDFSPNEAALGLLHVLIGSVPDNYQWLMRTLSFHGTVKQGIGELRAIMSRPEVLQHYPFLKSEGLFLLSFITFNFSTSPDDTGFLKQQLNNKANRDLILQSPLLIYAASAFYLHSGLSAEASTLLQNRPKGENYYPFHYLDYLTGLTKLYRLDASARVYFLRFVSSFKGKNFIKSAYQRLAWIACLDNNPEDYRKYMERVKLFGSDDIDGDKEALSEAENGEMPDRSLLRARLQFDGGYYTEALATLSSLQPEDFDRERDKLEYTYRMARIFHQTGNTAEAVSYYMKTLVQGENQTYYFAANSALMLGAIYESAGENEKAAFYYRKCLSMRYTEYRTSISQKAKAGLSCLK